MKFIVKRALPLFLSLTILCGILLTHLSPNTQAAIGNYYMINGKSVNCETVEDFGIGENEAYIRALYQYIWGVSYTEDFSSSDNILKNMLYEERELTVENLCRLVQRCNPGASCGEY